MNKKTQAELVPWMSATILIFFIMVFFVAGVGGIASKKGFSKNEVQLDSGQEILFDDYDLKFILNSEVFDDTTQKFTTVEEMIVRWDNLDGAERELFLNKMRDEINKEISDILTQNKIEGKFLVKKMGVAEGGEIIQVANNFEKELAEIKKGNEKTSFQLISKNKIYVEFQR